MKRTIPLNVPGRRIAYTGMASAFLAVAGDADAQIVYTDVDPDQQISSNEFGIDFDGDGIDDITIYQSSGSFYGIQFAGAGIQLEAGNAAIGTLNTLSSVSYVLPQVLALNAPIAPGNPAFQSMSSQTLAVNITGIGALGNWPGETGYVGVRFQSGGGTTHYAWVHLSVPGSAASVTIMGYAYQSTPNMAINAGDMGNVGLSPHAAPISVLGLAPNPASDRTWITVDTGNNGPVQLALVNTIGQVLREETVASRNGADRLEVDLGGVPTGTYFVRVQSGDQVAHRKLSVTAPR